MILEIRSFYKDQKVVLGRIVNLVIFLVPQKTGGTTGTGLKYRLPNQSTNENVLS